MSAGRSLLPWLIAALWCALLASAAGAIYSKYRARALFVQLERVEELRDQLDVDWGRLQLEQSAWSSYAFVERVASERLHMLAPDPHDIALITPAVPEASTALAVAANGPASGSAPSEASVAELEP